MKGIIKLYNAKTCCGLVVCEENRKTYRFNISNTDLDPRYYYDLKGLNVEFEPSEFVSFEPSEFVSAQGDRRIVTMAKKIKFV